MGRRSGTQNVMGAVGMAIALEAVADRDRFRRDVAEARIASSPGCRLPYPDWWSTPQQIGSSSIRTSAFPGCPTISC